MCALSEAWYVASLISIAVYDNGQGSVYVSRLTGLGSQRLLISKVAFGTLVVLWLNLPKVAWEKGELFFFHGSKEQ